MADLTEEQKIIIGVCVGVAGLILIAIVVFICCLFYAKERRRRRNGYKDQLVDRYDNRYDRYPVYEKEVPAVIYDPPPPPPMWREPPPPPMWREPVYHKRPRSIEVPYKYDTWDRDSEPPRKYNDNRYRTEPIVISAAEPEYVRSRAAQREPETIYLKYVSDNAKEVRYVSDNTKDIRYVDDQALLTRNNHSRRAHYHGGGGGGGGAGLRRSRSFHDVRGGSAYVGEWGRRPAHPSQFNERAMRDGHDPFLWA